MKNLSKILVVLLVGLFLISCSCKQQEQETFKPTATKVKIVEKVVPVACKIPKIECDFSGSNFVPTQKLLDCIIIQKKILQDCSKPISEVQVPEENQQE